MIHCFKLMSLQNSEPIWTQLISLFLGQTKGHGLLVRSRGPVSATAEMRTRENKSRIDLNETRKQKSKTGADWYYILDQPNAFTLISVFGGYNQTVSLKSPHSPLQGFSCSYGAAQKMTAIVIHILFIAWIAVDWDLCLFLSQPCLNYLAFELN